MRKSLLIYLVLILGSLCSQAQDNFVPGHIITANGDSIAGMINDQYWSAAPTSIQFQSTGVKTYEPKDILQFGVGTKALYRSLVIDYDSTSESRTLSKSMQPTFKREHVFLRVVLLSNPSLLEYRKDQTSHYFVQFGSEVTELINHAYEREVNGVINKFVNRQYIEQLRIIFKGCDQVVVSESTSYSEKELTSLLLSYYQCREFASQSFVREKTKTTMGIVGALAFDQMKKGFSGGMGFGAGIYFNFNFPDKLYKSSVYVEMLYRKFADQSVFRDPSQAMFGPPVASYSVDLSIQSIKLSVLYNTRLDKLSPSMYLETGFSTSSGLSDEFYYNDRLVGKKANLMWAFVLGTGFHLSDKARFGIRYELGSGVDFNDTGLLPSASGHQSFVGLLSFGL